MLRAALYAPAPHWPLIAFTGAAPLVLTAGVGAELALPALVAALLATIVVLGRLLADVQPGRPRDVLPILKEHALNYIVAAFLVGAVAFGLGLAASRAVPDGSARVAALMLGRAVVFMAAVYVVPLALLKRESVAAVPAGVVFLGRNLAASWWLLGLALLGGVLQLAARLIRVQQPGGFGFAVLLAGSVAVSYLGAATFAGALYVLLGVRVAVVRGAGASRQRLRR